MVTGVPGAGGADVGLEDVGLEGFAGGMWGSGTGDKEQRWGGEEMTLQMWGWGAQRHRGDRTLPKGGDAGDICLSVPQGQKGEKGDGGLQGKPGRPGRDVSSASCGAGCEAPAPPDLPTLCHARQSPRIHPIRAGLERSVWWVPRARR